jgi:hypothetical protein
MISDGLSGLQRTVVVSAGSLGTKVGGVSPAPLAATAGAGLEMTLPNQVHGFVRYDGQFSANQNENVLSAGARLEF